MNKFHICLFKHNCRWAFSIALLLMGAGCSPVRHLQEHEALLHKNIIKGIKGEQHRELAKLVRQQPNQQLLGMRIKLWWYYVTGGKKGEPPVIVDTALTARGTQLMKFYLINRGYFNAQTQYYIQTKRKKARVIYHIRPGSIYLIRNIILPPWETHFEIMLDYHSRASLLKPGEPYNTDKLEAERARLAENLRNEGYFFFNKDHIYFEIDSTLNMHRVDIYIKVRKTDPQVFNRYRLNEVFIYPDFSRGRTYTDTIDGSRYGSDYMGFRIITNDTTRYKWETLMRAVVFRQEQTFFLQRNLDFTLARLADLGIFSFINIRFDTIGIVHEQSSVTKPMNCYVELSPADKQTMSVEFESTTGRETIFGMGGKYIWRNKDLFRGAEQFTFDIGGGMEAMQEGGDTLQLRDFFNTRSLSAQLGLTIPKFLPGFLPGTKRISRNLNPKTRFTASYNFQRQPSLTLTGINIGFGYEWKEIEDHFFRKAPLKQHTVLPLVVNYVHPKQFSPTLLILMERNQQIKKSLQPHFILGLNYNFVHDASFTGKQHFWFYRFNVDFSGNMLFGIDWLISQLDRERTVWALKQDYSRYIRMEVDIRRYILFNRERMHLLVLRANGGFGIPTFQSEVLPYVKQFFAGGSNSIRAWRVRTLGPGSYNFRLERDFTVVNIVDQTGDIRLEGNIEWRFPLYRLFKGALFLDGGNIWTVYERDTLRQDAMFRLKKFYNEFALGGGLGLRLDFSLFIFRIDIGIKLHDPSLPPHHRWVIRYLNDSLWKNQYLETYQHKYPFLNFNFALGYPF